MRTLSKFVVGASLTAVLPSLVLAQPRGTVEIGGFGRFTQFADTLKLDAGLGGGGRAGVYIFKNWLLEMDLSYANTERNTNLAPILGVDTLKKVAHPLWNYRLLYNFPLSGEKVKLLLGGGYAYDSYQRPRVLGTGPIRGGGPSGLVGLRLGLNDWLSARIEGIGNYVPARDEAVKVVSGGQTVQTFDRPSSFNLGGQAGLSINVFGNDQSLIKKPTKIVRDTVRLVSRDTIYQTRIDTIKAPAAAGAGGMAEVVIGAVNFDYAKDGVTAEAKVILDQIATALAKPENAGRKVNIIGNTDAIGSVEGNRRLGQRRADGVSAYLKSKGVKDSQIGDVTTRGKENPIAPNSTANSRATNRRVLIILAN
ncbi:MAG: OmpA family protein [Gemmatimonadaceae bacterium]|nr:OmpA family protein [Gemmatimonadaceae bacterium]